MFRNVGTPEGAANRWQPMAAMALVVAAGFVGCAEPGPGENKESPKSVILSCSDEASPRERIACYETALHGDPENTRILELLAAALADAGNLRGAIDRLSQAVRLDPDDPLLLHQLSAALEDLGENEPAIENLEKVLELVASPEVHVKLGMLLSEQGKHEMAVTHYEEAIVLAPDDVDAHYNLGVELAREGKHAQAAGHYRDVLRVDDTHAEAVNNLGAALFSLGRAAEAAGYFEGAVQLDAADVQARGNWAMALAAQHRLGEAVTVLKAGLDVSPEAVTLANQLAWHRATAREAQWRDGEEAVRLAEAVCDSTDRADGNYLDTLAAAYAEAGRFADAVRTETRAIELAKENPELAREFRQRLSIYEDEKPYRDLD